MKDMTYGLIKPLIDAHTMGIYTVESLLKDCDRKVVRAPEELEYALNYISEEFNCQKIGQWIRNNKINALGVSFRLDPEVALNMVSSLYAFLYDNNYFSFQGGTIDFLFYAGLPESCAKIRDKISKEIITFEGGEYPEDTLVRLGVPSESIPHSIVSLDSYKKALMTFVDKIISDESYRDVRPTKYASYSEFGTEDDTVEKRIENAKKAKDLPIMRAHFGPFSADKTREENVSFFVEQCKTLAADGFLDVLSIGTSQLSQERFGDNWKGMIDGGGVPINSPEEYEKVRIAAKPMLVRTYAGTKNIRYLAEIYEKSLNISWHALSLWWFDELDGRGPNSLLDNLNEHIDTIRYVASCNRAFEANVPHHFAFRGCDDVTYVVAGYMGAYLAKKCGIHTFVLQNMLNTPKNIWAVQDLAKSRAMLKIVRELEDDSFRVILQPRAGLDFFKPNEQEAKKQLAYVSCLMDDIEPYNEFSPEVVHVVSYCEAMKLSTPDIIKESVQITKKAISEYRKYKRDNKGNSIIDEYENEICQRSAIMEREAKKRIRKMEENIENLYTATGMYKAFIYGWLPTPYLWNNKDEFKSAREYDAKIVNGEAVLVFNGKVVNNDFIIEHAIGNMNKKVENSDNTAIRCG